MSVAGGESGWTRFLKRMKRTTNKNTISIRTTTNAVRLSLSRGAGAWFSEEQTDGIVERCGWGATAEDRSFGQAFFQA